MSYSIQEAKSTQEILSCSPIFKTLRPQVPEESLVARINLQQKEGYHLIYLKDSTEIVTSLLGYRVLNFLFSGKTLYIDDLGTLPNYRGKGYGGALVDRVIEIARELKCDSITLDAGYQRRDAHRLYLNKKFHLEEHHLQMNLTY